MSKINGEKARASVASRRGKARRVKDRELRKEWTERQQAAAKAAAAKVPAPAAPKPKKAAAANINPDALIEMLRPVEAKPKAKKTE